MVGTDLPQRVVAAHAVVAHQRVHQGLLEGMAHVQGGGRVRRRQPAIDRGPQPAGPGGDGHRRGDRPAPAQLLRDLTTHARGR
ncbi:hypothetical protein G6F59_017616 [Rhizopus arrhizus]|nr:hypothetical protein G6F59_017616 [Rhizopus arrhizus]